MIKTITLHNVQIHRHASINLDKSLTVLTGSSDSGKSSFVRAIRWLLQGVPNHKYLLRNNKKSMYVEIVLDTGHTVRRTYAKGRPHTISLGYKGKTKTFKAFGREIPPEVKQVLNIDPISIQSQSDPHYFFTGSPADVARKICEISHLGSAISFQAKIPRYVTCVAGKMAEEKEQETSLRKKLKTLRISQADLVTAKEQTARMRSVAEVMAVLRNLYSLSDRIREYRKEQRSTSGVGERERQAVRKTQARIRAISLITTMLWNTDSLCRGVMDAKTRYKDLEALKERRTREKDSIIRKIGVCPLCGK